MQTENDEVTYRTSKTRSKATQKLDTIDQCLHYLKDDKYEDGYTSVCVPVLQKCEVESDLLPVVVPDQTNLLASAPQTDLEQMKYEGASQCAIRKKKTPSQHLSSICDSLASLA